jgi:hypothetical protein
MTVFHPYESSMTTEKSEPQSKRHVEHIDKPYLALLLFGSLVAMLPWPVIATSGCLRWSMFDRASEAMLLFGGFTLMCLLPIGMFDPPEWVFAVLIGIVWLLALILPVLFVVRRRHSKGSVVAMLVSQAAFSLAQAGLGLLMIWGKNV